MSSTKDPKKCPDCGGLPGLWQNNRCPVCHVKYTHTPQATQVWNGDNPPGITTAVSLANAPQATDPNSHKDCEQCRSEEKMQQALAQATKPVDELRAEILTEFKQVLKLAPDDYTENCTNVVMSMVEAYISNQVAKARGCTSCGKLTCDNCERLWQT